MANNSLMKLAAAAASALATRPVPHFVVGLEGDVKNFVQTFPWVNVSDWLYLARDGPIT
jgi:hypothetical protein